MSRVELLRKSIANATTSTSPVRRVQTASAPTSPFTIDGTSGALTPFGPDVPLPSRAVHLSGNAAGTHVLLAHNDPSGVTVIALEPNGALDRDVVQPTPVDVGVFAHQVLTDAVSDSIVFLVTRGIAPAPTTPEKPGAIKEFRFVNGVLAKVGNVAPAGGFGFQARNLDFHPTKPRVSTLRPPQA
ncbi:MAG: hypothetical protein ABIT20_11000 [Gemmatimonadaceae bacterium]